MHWDLLSRSKNNQFGQLFNLQDIQGSSQEWKNRQTRLGGGRVRASSRLITPPLSYKRLRRADPIKNSKNQKLLS